jgi:3-hydroxyisobutyrate dehydrogenase-like beta-hydroxyacid dehydrogenase
MGNVTHEPVATVGIVGLGAMGGPMAEFIARGGFRVLAYDTAEAPLPAGVEPAAQLADLAPCEAVFVVVPTEHDVEEVVLGARGLVGVLAPGAIVLVSSSVTPDAMRRLADPLRLRGIGLLDAALTGGVRGAVSGQLNLLLGGDADLVGRMLPVFDTFCIGHHLLGDLGAGQVAKAANNLIHWAQIIAFDEAFRLAKRFGVDPEHLRTALRQSPTDSRGMRELEEMRFTWYAKDLEGVFSLAATSGIDVPVARLCRQKMDSITVASMRAVLHGDA